MHLRVSSCQVLRGPCTTGSTTDQGTVPKSFGSSAVVDLPTSCHSKPVCLGKVTNTQIMKDETTFWMQFLAGLLDRRSCATLFHDCPLIRDIRYLTMWFCMAGCWHIFGQLWKPERRNTEQNAERGTEVMWFHTGNYTEMMQEVWHEVTINGSFPATTLCSSTANFRRPSSLSLKIFRQI